MKHRIILPGLLAACLAVASCTSGTTSGDTAATGSSGSAAPTTTTTSAATADPVTWAGAFCDGMGVMAQGMVEMLQALLAGGNATDPAAQKAALLQFSEKSGTALTAASEELARIGAPSPETRALHDELVGYFGQAGKGLTDANRELAGLDPNDPQFSAKLEQLGGEAGDPTTLRQQVEKIQGDPVLGAAFKQAPQCTAMGDLLRNMGG
ncbi:hypothetical protein [Saccharothrix coeruleofusca]|uniref:Small secreted protein n=1 Tax=Saccharothrix coeruleofusca TaxID=33919 RepID=A0A918AIA5_9PSEU|nr:hypothetical protein [Saccharothrix coeruleofusca]MBP2340339.1 hypothetical protein [Saccharothrix coeruleofusca]GGP36086.1 hypothetical protein GCM10010185_03890 [Saccharothrix coeruleofusca]